jgi:transglutaminase-like putative cysteine protease
MVAATGTVPASTSTGTSFRIKYTVTIVTMNSTMDRLQVYLPVPREWDSQEAVQIEQISPKPTSVDEDHDYGNKMAYFQLFDIPRGQSLDFTIQYSFTFHEIHTHVDPAKVGQYNASDPTYIKYAKQRPDDNVESDDPAIQKAASEIVGKETNPYLKAKLVYNWLVENIRYEFPSPWGAKETYLKRAGDCGKYTALFCAMAISQGIPCRPIAGLQFSAPFPHTYSSKGNPADVNAYGMHVYAEFFLPNYGWIPVDATFGRGTGKPDRYFGDTWDAFLINSKGYGIWTVPPISDIGKLSTLQLYAYWFWGKANAYDDYFTYTVDKVSVTPTTTVTGAQTGTEATLTTTQPSTSTSGGSVSILLIGVVVAVVAVAVLAGRRKRAAPQRPVPVSTASVEPASKFCVNCGFRMPDTDVFCGACGTRQP